MRLFRFLPMVSVLALMLAPCLRAADDEDMRERVAEAVQILGAKQKSSNPVPPKVLRKARGLALVEVTKGGLGVSGQLGEGVLLLRTKEGWSAPIAFSMGGGSVGFQIGFEKKRFIFVLNTEKAVESFTSEEKVSLDAKTTATAGPDSVAEEASTLPEGDLFVYTSTGGAFAGAAVGGQIISVDGKLNRKTYGPETLTGELISGQIKRPEFARKLYELIAEGETAK